MFSPLPGVIVADRYELIREIGRGGMGCVWEAVDTELRAPCALKFILEQAAASPEMRTRFLREARGVAKLQSPHVVNIRSVGEHDDALFIAMELLQGETLRQRLEREGTLSPQDTLTLVQQVSSVLTLAHEAGVVHRDLKPENIWLWANQDLFVKVIDFGVAKHLSDGDSSLKTATGALVGTPRYMSPEQAAGDKAVDHRTDIWSLAMIAAECLSGRQPFDGCGVRQVLITIILGPVPSLTELYPAATPELEAWWRRATANRPHRIQSAQELARSFANALTARAPLVPSLLATPISEWVQPASSIDDESETLPLEAGSEQLLTHDSRQPRNWRKAWLAIPIGALLVAALGLFRLFSSLPNGTESPLDGSTLVNSDSVLSPPVAPPAGEPTPVTPGVEAMDTSHPRLERMDQQRPADAAPTPPQRWATQPNAYRPVEASEPVAPNEPDTFDVELHPVEEEPANPIRKATRSGPDVAPLRSSPSPPPQAATSPPPVDTRIGF